MTEAVLIVTMLFFAFMFCLTMLFWRKEQDDSIKESEQLRKALRAKDRYIESLQLNLDKSERLNLEVMELLVESTLVADVATADNKVSEAIAVLYNGLEYESIDDNEGNRGRAYS